MIQIMKKDATTDGEYVLTEGTLFDLEIDSETAGSIQLAQGIYGYKVMRLRDIQILVEPKEGITYTISIQTEDGVNLLTPIKITGGATINTLEREIIFKYPLYIEIETSGEAAAVLPIFLVIQDGSNQVIN